MQRHQRAEVEWEEEEVEMLALRGGGNQAGFLGGCFISPKPRGLYVGVVSDIFKETVLCNSKGMGSGHERKGF